MFSTKKTFINTKNSTEVTSVTMGRSIFITNNKKTSNVENFYQSPAATKIKKSF